MSWLFKRRIKFDGQPVRGIDDLHKLLTGELVGKQIPITVIRGVQKLTFDVVQKKSGDTDQTDIKSRFNF